MSEQSREGEGLTSQRRAEEQRTIKVAVLLVAAAAIYFMAVQYYQARGVGRVPAAPVERPLP